MWCGPCSTGPRGHLAGAAPKMGSEAQMDSGPEDCTVGARLPLNCWVETAAGAGGQAQCSCPFTHPLPGICRSG